jgi:uncharacterized protein (DUF3084 family)
MVAEIERDKVSKIETLTQEIRERQKIINDTSEFIQRKNAKIFKEMKKLREENESLANEKLSIMEEFKQAEEAFNSEVTLRLHFENKINEIHGVHTEMKTKHERLYLNFQSSK